MVGVYTLKFTFLPSDQPHLSEISTTSFGSGAPSVDALHDSLRNDGSVSIASRINNQHPLQRLLEDWDASHNEVQLQGIRNIIGPQEVIRRSMELEIVKSTEFCPEVLGGPSKLHLDILRNKDTKVDWEDIYQGEPQGMSNVGLHHEMRKRMGL